MDSIYAFFERLLDPIRPGSTSGTPSRPPDRTAAFFLAYLHPLKGLIAVTLVIAGIAAVSELALYAFLGLLVDWMANTDPALFFEVHGWALVGMAVVALIIRPISTLASRGLINLAIVPGLTNRVRWENHRYVVRQSLNFFQNDFAGRIAQKVMQTGPALREAVVNVIDGVWFLAIYLIGTIALLVGLDWRLLIPVALWMVGYAVVIMTMVPPVRARSAAVSEANSSLSGRIVDSYSNIQSVKLFAHGEREDQFARVGIDRHTSTFRQLMRSILTMTVTLTVLNSLLILAIAVQSITMWQAGAISVGAIATANGLIIRLTQMSGWVLRTITSLFENIGTVQNGVDTVSRPNVVMDTPGARPLQVTKGEIRFENVRFNYGADPDSGSASGGTVGEGGSGVIDDVSLTVAPGEKIGLVGPSGAGKSTLVNILLRFHDLEGGRITIDGQDIASVTQDSLRANIAMVSQDTSLMHRSIRDNIRYGRPDASDADIAAAARHAKADTFIPDLVDPHGRTGYDAHVGERGIKLSGGQRQRIAIARVILKDAPILILDEATSALDSEVEAAIQEQLDQLMEGKTVIAIAHRLSTIAAMNRLVVLDQGRIVEEGTHTDLVDRRGIYSRLWKRQSGGFIRYDQAI
ncbi:ABC transporter ATP-binding protein [Fodinicurvata sp. EGI_FJ10296]|uniref:ABC transporter ATP-binding protein n=1 Tax=Fodinicurvata sp. EGI_FJ10296 TaxID=3231908 RepID=UPI0034515799